MNAIHLVNDNTSEIIYQPLRKELILRLKGIVSASQLSLIRNLITKLFGNLKACTFVLDIENSEYQELSFYDVERMDFYRVAEKEGIKYFLLKYQNKFFRDQLQKQWEVFFSRNNINIQVLKVE